MGHGVLLMLLVSLSTQDGMRGWGAALHDHEGAQLGMATRAWCGMDIWAQSGAAWYGGGYGGSCGSWCCCILEAKV